MFYMKSDDIEELFREAAEKYQIDTEKAAAWDDVYEAVHGNGRSAPPTPSGNEHKKRWLNLLWLLLIPLGWFAHNVWNNMESKTTVKKEQAAVNKDVSKGDNKQPAGNAEPTKSNSDQQPAASTGNTATVNLNKAETGAVSADAAKQAANKATTFAANNTGFRTKQQLQIKTGGAAVGKNTGSEAAETKTAVGLVPNTGFGLTAKTGGNNKPAEPGAVLSTNNGQIGDKKEDSPASLNSSSDANNTAGEPVTEANKKSDKKDNKVKKQQEHFFYAGLMASPDISFIHGQKISPAGVNAGLLLGYQFNKHLSVETGVLFDSKNYYTNGSYFDKSKIKYFAQNPEVSVNSIDGDCKMIEIPLNIKYVFLAKNKNRWYAVAGMSSYLMGREYYAYDLSAWGTSYKTGLAYNNHVKNWFSIANLGLGYERSLGTKTNLRIEPFMKVPVSGVGTGNLSLTSTGLFIGLTRRIP